MRFYPMSLEEFDSNVNMMEHIIAFHDQMSLYDTSDTLQCCTLLTMLRDIARE